MLNEEDYSSDTSDEDFVPQGAESDDEDEPMSDNVSDNNDDEENKVKKQKKAKTKAKKKNPLLSAVVDSDEEIKNEHDEELEIKEPNSKKEDDLWADFLSEVDEKPVPPSKPKPTKSWAHLLGNKKDHPATPSETNSSKAFLKESTERKTMATDPVKATTVKVTKIFEFAGEEIKIEEEVPANSVAATINAAKFASKNTIKEHAVIKRPLGLSGVVSLLDSKKQKLTTLEKTKLDWNRFKSSEGIEEELETHKKSKSGYLEKQEFLERADLRQFEIEKAMRISKRSNR